MGRWLYRLVSVRRFSSSAEASGGFSQAKKKLATVPRSSRYPINAAITSAVMPNGGRIERCNGGRLSGKRRTDTLQYTVLVPVVCRCYAQPYRVDVEHFKESRPRRGWPKGKPRKQQTPAEQP